MLRQRRRPSPLPPPEGRRLAAARAPRVREDTRMFRQLLPRHVLPGLASGPLALRVKLLRVYVERSEEQRQPARHSRCTAFRFKVEHRVGNHARPLRRTASLLADQPADCPGRKTPFRAVRRAARPYGWAAFQAPSICMCILSKLYICNMYTSRYFRKYDL